MTFVDHIINTFSKKLAPYIKKGVLDHENRWGIDVLFNKTALEKGLLMFHFITKDNLEIELEFDLRRLKQDGKKYFNEVMEIFLAQTEAAREERQAHSAITLVPYASLQQEVSRAVKQRAQMDRVGEKTH